MSWAHPAPEPRGPRGPRITFVVQSYPKPTETFIAAQRVYLDARVIVRDYVGDLPVPPYVSVLPRAAGAREIGLISRRLYRRFKYGRPAGSYLSPRQERVMRDLLREGSPAVVVAQFGPSAIDVAAACRELDISLVVHFHGADLSSYVRASGYVAEMRRALRTASAVVVVSGSMERAFRAHFPEFSGAVALIPYGVSLPANRLTRAHAGVTHGCHFVAVGRLVPKKGILHTLAAFAGAHERDPSIRLTVAGEGPLRESVDAFVANKGLKSVVKVLGVQPHSHVLDLLTGADIFVQHSLTARGGDAEGWPVAIAEAAAAGLPVVATRHAGIPEQVVDGVTGYLVEEGDVDAMQEALFALAANPELRKSFGEAARAHIAQFDRQRQLAQLQALLQAVITESQE